MRRVRVGLLFNGVEQFYQREEEVRDTKTGRWIARPYFHNKREAITMSEEIGLRLVERLRGLKLNPWMEDVNGERHLDLPQQNVPNSGVDNRTTATATLDDQCSPDARWYLVHPINRPDGAGQWFLKCTPPGFPNAQIIYTKHPLDCLQRAQDLNLLQYGERAPAPEPPAAPVRTTDGSRRRPGDRWN